MALEQYAGQRIDAMNGRQLAEFARSVGQAAVCLLAERDTEEMDYRSVVTQLTPAFLDTSEVAFGMSVASDLDIISVAPGGSGRVVRNVHTSR